MTEPKPKRKLNPFARKPSFPANFSKAYLRNFGKGRLSYNEVALTFSLEKGLLKKQKATTKEIPFANIEAANLEANELAVVWNGTTDRFVIEDKEFAAKILGVINEALLKQKQSMLTSGLWATPEPSESEPEQDEIEQAEEPQTSPAQVAQAQTSPEPPRVEEPSTVTPILETQPTVQIDLRPALISTLPTIDLLFDILGTMHGNVDWSKLKEYADKAEKTAKNAEGLKTHALSFVKLISDVQDHKAEAIPKDTQRLLKAIYERFQNLTCPDGSTTKIDKKCGEVMTAIHAYYILNDVFLASIVGDKDIQEELDQLEVSLENLKELTESEVDPTQIIPPLSTLILQKEIKQVSLTSREAFKQQLKLLAKKDQMPVAEPAKNQLNAAIPSQ